MIQHRKDFWQLLESLGLKGEVAEIGVAEGNNSELMASWDCVIKMWMVDNWATIEGQKGDGSEGQAWHNLNHLRCQVIAENNPKCVMLKGMSIEMAKTIPDDSLIMVYIDADHSYDGVMADINAWEPKIITLGIIAFHDYLAPQYGVFQAVNDFASKNGYEVNLITEDNESDASAWIRVERRNRL